MIVDTSAIVAIVLGEPMGDTALTFLRRERGPKMSAATRVELHVVVERWRSPLHVRRTQELLLAVGVEIVPLTSEHAEIAREAFLTYGRGMNSRAKLNLGDCFSYALAKATGEPLLFVGNDFTHTDLLAAIPSYVREV